MAKVTLQEIMMTVRELTFDRFIIPAFAVKQSERFELSVTKTRLQIVQGVKDFSVDFVDYPTLGELTNKLLDDGVIIAFTPYFKTDEPSASLVIRELGSLETTLYRRYFFSDASIIKEIEYYYYKVLGISGVEINDELIQRLRRPSEKHLAIWVAYRLVERRRLYENAVPHIGESYSDGSDYMAGSGSSLPTSTTVTIGSVFSITEDATQGYFYEDFNRIGSDNTWGDRYSFWYKLMLYLRGLLEDDFGDYTLRKDTVMGGTIDLVRDLDFRSYYDSYPFTLSPLSRGIITKTP